MERVLASDDICPYCAFTAHAREAYRCIVCRCEIGDGLCSWCGTPYREVEALLHCPYCSRVSEGEHCSYCGLV